MCICRQWQWTAAEGDFSSHEPELCIDGQGDEHDSPRTVVVTTTAIPAELLAVAFAADFLKRLGQAATARRAPRWPLRDLPLTIDFTRWRLNGIFRD